MVTHTHTDTRYPAWLYKPIVTWAKSMKYMKNTWKIITTLTNYVVFALKETFQTGYCERKQNSFRLYFLKEVLEVEVSYIYLNYLNNEGVCIRITIWVINHYFEDSWGLKTYLLLTTQLHIAAYFSRSKDNLFNFTLHLTELKNVKVSSF